MNAFSPESLIPHSAWPKALAAIMGLLSISSPHTLATTSAVVGFYGVSVPAGNSAWVSGLVGADLYQGAAATVTADVDGKALVTFSAPGWTGSEFTSHYAEPQTGTAAGLAIDILSNTTDTLKLDATPTDLSASMVFIVRKHATLAGLLPDGGGLAPFSDSLSLFGTNGLQTSYFWNNSTSKWINALFADSSTVVIRPGQGFVIQAASPLTMTLGKGEIAYVKTTATRIKASASVPNLVGALNPLGSTTTLGALGVTSSLLSFNDSVVTLNSGTLAQTGTFLSNGTNLINGLFQNANSTSLPGGASIVINVGTTKNITIAPVTVGP